MPVYWVATYSLIRDPDRVAVYAALGGPAIEAAGGRFLARGEPLAVLEGGSVPRATIIEFDDLDAARAAHASAGYQAALRELGDAAIRDIRILGA